MAKTRYDVAISFAGEDRMIAEEIAMILFARKYRVFYDRFEQHALLGEDLGGYLPDIYSKQSRYCVVVVSDNYAKKVWTRLEFKSAIAGAVFADPPGAFVLPLRLDDTELSGLQSTVGYVDLRENDVREFADLLTRKIGPPMDGGDQDVEEIVGIDETLAMCRAHLVPGMNAKALQQFGAALRKRIVVVQPLRARQLIAGIIAELIVAERDNSLVADSIARIEAGMRALADISGQSAEAAPRVTRKNRRGRLVALAVGCVLVITMGIWLAVDEFTVSADDRSLTRGPGSTATSSTTPKQSVSTISSTTTAPTTVGGGVPSDPAEEPESVTAPTNQPEPEAPPAAPRQLSVGAIVLAPTDGFDLDADQRGLQTGSGMDISPSEDGSQIYGMSHGKPKLAVVYSAAATGPDLCETVAADAWQTPLPGLHGMSVGDRICVLTDRGNFGVLTLRTVPSSDAVDLDIDYIAWARQ